jgi:hypothetical protein
MPRTARASVGGMIYHAFNRGNRRGWESGGSSLFGLLTGPPVSLGGMARPTRPISDGLVYNAVNRGNNRADAFATPHSGPPRKGGGGN